MRIRIVGDGTFYGTRVETEDGELVHGVTGVEFKLDRETRLAEARLTFLKVPVDIKGEVDE